MPYGFVLMYLFSFSHSGSTAILSLRAARLPVPSRCLVCRRQRRCPRLRLKGKNRIKLRQVVGWRPWPLGVWNLWLLFAVLKLESNTIMTVPIYFCPSFFYFYLYRKLILILNYWSIVCNHEKLLLLWLLLQVVAFSFSLQCSVLM